MLFIAIEFVIGLFGGSAFIDTDFSNMPRMELMVEILLFYFSLAFIFFLSTIIPGTINVLLLKMKKYLLYCLLFSMAGGLIGIIVYAFLFSFLSYVLKIHVVPMFLILLGFVSGFNFSLYKFLLKEQKTEV